MGLKEDVLALADELEAFEGDTCEGCAAYEQPECRVFLPCAEIVAKCCARKMREAVERDGEGATTVSAYDLLSDEDREAIAWVREQGGLDAVKKLLDWVVGHCSTRQQLDFDFWLSGRVMYELGFDEDMADRDEVGRRLLARLMPEGYEWPRYESGEPLRYEDRYVYDGREREVWHVDFDSYGEPTILNKDGTRFHPDKGERVERPAPKVLDADGAEVHKGDEVWSTTGEFAGKRTVSSVHVDPGEPPYAMFEERQKPYSCLCCYLTHRAPVLAADGKPICEGETVWGTGREEHEYVVLGQTGLGGGAGRFKVACHDVTDDVDCDCDPDLLTHELPDSWERLEEDAGCTATKYNERRGTIFTTKQQVARDLVRRAKKLAGVDND